MGPDLIYDGDIDGFVAKISVNPYCTVISPNGGEIWKLGTSQIIKWNAVGLSNNLKITLWRNGVFMDVIANNISPSTGSYVWPIGLYSSSTIPAGGGYMIMIKEINTTISDTSDASFSIRY